MLNVCCQLEEVSAENACQEVELALPIVCKGDDLLGAPDRWRSLPQPQSRAIDYRGQSINGISFQVCRKNPQVQSKAHDPHQLRLKSYRVLLSRGRDGVVVVARFWMLPIRRSLLRPRAQGVISGCGLRAPGGTPSGSGSDPQVFSPAPFGRRHRGSMGDLDGACRQKGLDFGHV